MNKKRVELNKNPSLKERRVRVKSSEFGADEENMVKLI